MRPLMLCAVSSILMMSAPVVAAEIRLAGIVVNSCILSIPTPGTMGLSSDGVRLGSQEGVGGAPATLTIVAAGIPPTLNFSAPALSGPSGTSGSVTEYAFTSSGSGASQPFTSASSTAASNLIDTFTIQSRVSRAQGFGTGTYTVAVTVTCQQL